jgi:hypothetical protein
MDYRKRLEKFGKLENKRFKKIYEVNARSNAKIAKMEKRDNDLNARANAKIANESTKFRVTRIAQDLVLSNTISLEELSQLDIQYKTMSQICESITKKFGKTRLEHLDKNRILSLSEMDDFEVGELIDLSSITSSISRKRKEEGKDSWVWDAVEVKERRKKSKEKLKKSKEKMKEMEKYFKENQDKIYQNAMKSMEEFEKKFNLK